MIYWFYGNRVEIGGYQFQEGQGDGQQYYEQDEVINFVE